MSDIEIVPSLCVVPIVGLHPDGGCGPFLGTGSFVGEEKVLVTCEHVLSQWDGLYGISAHEDQPQIYVANTLHRNSNIDLACLKVEGYEPPYSFPLAEDEEIILNQHVCAFEYGTTETIAGHINFSPANRMGNVTRIRDLRDRFNGAGDHMLELSFPALKGASGAPIITWRPPFKLFGILSQNVARELHPSQVETIEDEGGNVVEEIKFYLPQGLAIHVKHVRDLIGGIET